MAKRNNLERCILCNAGLPEAPPEGVTVMNTVFVMDPRLCPECAGLYPPSRALQARPLRSPSGAVRPKDTIRP